MRKVPIVKTNANYRFLLKGKPTGHLSASYDHVLGKISRILGVASFPKNVAPHTKISYQLTLHLMAIYSIYNQTTED